MWPRMALRKNFASFFVGFLILYCIFYFFRIPHQIEIKENTIVSTDYPPLPLIKTMDEELGPLRAPFEPYTIPNELDYEEMDDVMPHMWKNAIESPLPTACRFITFNYLRSMNLGETMFIYASLYGVARKTNRIPFIDYFKLEFPLVQDFQLNWMPTNGITTDSSYTIIPEKEGPYKYDNTFLKIPCSRKIVLSGYRQNHRYFHAYKRELLSTEFILKDHIAKPCVNEFNNILSKNRIPSNCHFIGVHIRHQSELTNRQKNDGHIGADREYLQTAFDYFIKKYENSSCVVFLVAGKEGMKKNKELIPTNIENESGRNLIRILYVENNMDIIQLCILSMCRNSIITTGPTGWWIAYMTQQRNGGEVVYQGKYATEGTSLVNDLDPKSYFLDSWISK